MPLPPTMRRTARKKNNAVMKGRSTALMSANPARILGDPKRGTLAVGAYADVAVFDVERPYRIDPESFRSKGRSTPFAGMEVCGKTLLTVAGGRIVYRNME